MKQRILIYRLGSLGDTVVALPALHFIAGTFPEAERWVLTNFTINAKAASIAQILDGTSLVHGYIEYPVSLRNVGDLLKLRHRVRALRPDTLVYLAEPRGRVRTFRDEMFFRWCGIRRLIGLPYSSVCQRPLRINGSKYEYESARLIRCLHTLGDAQIDANNSSNLHLRRVEHEAARCALEPLNSEQPIVAAGIGAKVDVKDWGDAKWFSLLRHLSQTLTGWQLILLGAGVERARTEEIAKNWTGPFLNLCGRLTVRESAAALANARLFIGHDSGLMHLAAAVNIPCVAIFSSQNLPGHWFPYGDNHHVIYKPMPCHGCRLEVCLIHNKSCIRSIGVAEVAKATMDVLRNHTI